MSITASTIADNRAGQSGGAVHNSAFSVLELTNSTISGNTARFGGGIYNNPEPTAPEFIGDSAGGVTSQSLGGVVTGTNVTLAGNSASEEGGGILNRGGATNSGTVHLLNAVIANSNSGGDCSGIITSLGHNLDSDGTCGLMGPGDFPHSVIDLAPLADNGGPTLTHALPRLDQRTDVVIRNNAIDGGDAASCPATDQRGEPRPFDGDGDGAAICDIGAFELREAPLKCEPAPCGVQFATPSPTPALPIGLPPTGGASGKPGAAPFAAVAALPVMALALAVARRVFTQR